MVTNYLTVPIQIEGLYLDSPKQVSNPLADFSKLPWNDGTKDIHYEQPFVSHSIIKEPFESQNLMLGKGVHLHFIIPHFLGQQVPKTTQLPNAGKLPAAPNRWIITRTSDNTQWLIESDYVHSEGYKPLEPTCIIPFSQKGTKPFRYMGRKTSLNERRASGSYLKSFGGNPLTVAGYGDINFSSFYPNCLGVFGFYDPQGTIGPSSSPYTVIGWNEDPEEDLLHQVISEVGNSNPDDVNASTQKFLKDNFHLDLNLGEHLIDGSSPPRTIFYGQMTINGDAETPNTGNLNISLGYTGTEALSALIAQKKSNERTIPKKIIEDQIESTFLHSKLDHLIVDTGPKFCEARHEKGFRSSHSGYQWKVVTQIKSTSNESADAQAPPPLSDNWAILLDTLNGIQRAYDSRMHSIITLKEQLYYDWFKYMHARYYAEGSRGQHPDADHVMYFIETYVIKEINEQLEATGELIYGNESTSFQPSSPSGKQYSNSLANQLIDAWNAVSKELQLENTQRINQKQPSINLSMIPGPRYWEASAPVVLVSGLNQGNSTDTDCPVSLENKKYLTCELHPCSLPLNATTVASLIIDSLSKNSFKLDQQKWSPFIMDWEIGLVDTKLKTNMSFDPDGLQNNFDLDPLGPDLQKVDYKSDRPSTFSGTVLMSDHAKRSILHHIEISLTNWLKQKNISFKGQNTIENFLSASIWSLAYPTLDLSSSKESVPENVDYAYALCSLQAAYYQLQSGEVVSQTLNGFNQASIMLKKVPQLPIREPIGFNYESDFSSTVAKLVGKNHHSSPMVKFNFNPVLSGKMSINRLNLIDNFGEVTNLLPSNSNPIIASENLLDENGAIFLKPRLAQPARLNFRWLSAQSGNILTDTDLETNDHPDTSPICGWLMSDYINNTIAVFSADGSALGYVDSDAYWNVLPWVKGANDPQSSIKNTHLLNVILKLCSSSNFINKFITTTQAALNNIAPANTNLQEIKSLLMGRPMAVVRSSISFEIKGRPAIDQHWSSLLVDLTNCDNYPSWTYANRNQDNWTALKLPFRLGEHSQLNDGLIGYWMEDNGILNSKFITAEAAKGDINSTMIQTSDTGQFQTQWMAIIEGKLKTTMLIDPRGLVHATSGILPTKAISIPPEYYLKSMQKLGMWFHTSPIVQPYHSKRTAITMNLPPVEGYQWQWWDGLNGNKKINSESDKKENHTSSKILDGWLSLIPNGNNDNS